LTLHEEKNTIKIKNKIKGGEKMTIRYMEYNKKDTPRLSINLPQEIIDNLDKYTKENNIRSRKRLIEILVIKATNKL